MPIQSRLRRIDIPGLTKEQRLERESLWEEGLKRCTRCLEIFPSKEFSKKVTGWRGLASGCKSCLSADCRDWYSKNSDDARENARRYRVENNEVVRERDRARYQADPTKSNEQSRRWRLANAEQHRANHRAWHQANRDSEVERSRAYREAHREHLCALDRAYGAARRKSDPLYERLKGGATRAKKLGLEPDTFSSDDLLAYWAAHGIAPDRCYYTGRALEGRWQLDHMTPLSRGGTHSMDNLVPCARGVNEVKHTRTAEEYRASLTLNEEIV